jgi:hypothetical protein
MPAQERGHRRHARFAISYPCGRDEHAARSENTSAKPAGQWPRRRNRRSLGMSGARVSGGELRAHARGRRDAGVPRRQDLATIELGVSDAPAKPYPGGPRSSSPWDTQAPLASRHCARSSRAGIRSFGDQQGQRACARACVARAAVGQIGGPVAARTGLFNYAMKRGSSIRETPDLRGAARPAGQVTQPRRGATTARPGARVARRAGG